MTRPRAANKNSPRASPCIVAVLFERNPGRAIPEAKK